MQWYAADARGTKNCGSLAATRRNAEPLLAGRSRRASGAQATLTPGALFGAARGAIVACRLRGSVRPSTSASRSSGNR